MQAYVHREILDDSISGNKIYGGSIDGLTSIVLNGAGTSMFATGGIPGVPCGEIRGDFAIGTTTNKILSVVCNDFSSYNFIKLIIGTISAFNVYNDGSFNPILDMRDFSNSLRVRISPKPSLVNYIMNKFVFGANAFLRADTALDVSGKFYASGQIMGNAGAQINGTVSMTDGSFFNGGGTTYFQAWYTQYLSDVYSKASIVTVAEMQQIANIGTNLISATQWGYVGAMDQDVDTAASVVFDAVTTSDYDGTGSALLIPQKNFITGMEIVYSNASPNRISVNAGACRATAGGAIVGHTMVMDISSSGDVDAVWPTGKDAGTSGTHRHVFVIAKEDGTDVTWGLDSSSSAANLRTGDYDDGYYRRIGSIFLNTFPTPTAVIPFRQIGNTFIFDEAIPSGTGATPASFTLFDLLYTANNRSVIAKIKITLNPDGVHTGAYSFSYMNGNADDAVSLGTTINFNTAATVDSRAYFVDVATDTSQRIYIQSASTYQTNHVIHTLGWIDTLN